MVFKIILLRRQKNGAVQNEIVAIPLALNQHIYVKRLTSLHCGCTTNNLFFFFFYEISYVPSTVSKIKIRL